MEPYEVPKIGSLDILEPVPKVQGIPPDHRGSERSVRRRTSSANRPLLAESLTGNGDVAIGRDVGLRHEEYGKEDD